MVEKEKDITERLREQATDIDRYYHPQSLTPTTDGDLMREAADEIENLRSEVERLRAALNHAWEMGIAKEAVPIVRAALGQERGEQDTRADEQYELTRKFLDG